METTRTIGKRFAVEAELDRGRFCTTYLAKDEKTGRPCCLKEITLNVPAEAAMHALFGEPEGMARQHHPRVPAFLGCVVEADRERTKVYVANENLRSKSLQQLVTEGHRYSPVEVIHIGLGIVQMLQELQEAHVPLLHEDLRPSTILMTSDRRVYLTDLAAISDVMQRYPDALRERLLSTVATAYMAPERRAGTPQPASDPYALGAILLFLLTGKNPSQFSLLKGELDFEAHTYVSPAFKRVLKTMLRQHWRRRYKDLEQVRTALEGLLIARPTRRLRLPLPQPRLIALLAAATGLAGVLVATR